jgi:hypothetical protein
VSLRRPSPFAVAVLAVALAVTFVGVLTYYSARKFTHDAADLRASEEALSLAEQSAYTATGDAFNGYLQILRYADDPVIRAYTSTEKQRRTAMQQQLLLYTNKLDALAIVARDGTIFATTDPSITDMKDSEAFNKTRASLNPTNSDIVLPGDSGPGYVEFTAPLRLADGAVWAILYARAQPDVLWRTTLRTSVDGSRNVILNSDGLFAAGVPDGMLRRPWRGAPLDNGGVRADIVGVDSICGLGTIGADTQIDHGWHVASCMPISLIQRQADRAMGQQALVAAAGAVLAVVVAGGLLWVTLNGRGGPASTMREPAPAAAHATEADVWSRDDEPGADPSIEHEPNVEQIAGDPDVGLNSSDPDGESVPAPDMGESSAGDEPATAPLTSIERTQVIVADVDALALIDAYERRAERASRQLRESVQARLMIVSTQIDEADRMRESDPERAAHLHEAAMNELATVRERELRSLGQELHPGFVRLGLPGALRAFQKELAGTIELSLDVDPASDAPKASEQRIAIDPARRLVAFRTARNSVSALRDSGATRIDLSLSRDGDLLHLRVEAAIERDVAFDGAALSADALALTAYGGRLAWQREGTTTTVTGELPAPGVAVEPDEEDADGAETSGRGEEGPDVRNESDELNAAAAPPAPVVVVPIPLQLEDGSLAEALRGLAAKLAGFDLTLDVADDFEERDAIDAERGGLVRTMAGAAVSALARSGAAGCSVTLRRIHEDAYLSVMADEGADALDAAQLDAASRAIEAAGGHVSVGRFEGAVTITAELPSAHAENPPNVVQLDRAPVLPDDDGAEADMLDMLEAASEEADPAGSDAA